MNYANYHFKNIYSLHFVSQPIIITLLPCTMPKLINIHQNYQLIHVYSITTSMNRLTWKILRQIVTDERTKWIFNCCCSTCVKTKDEFRTLSIFITYIMSYSNTRTTKGVSRLNLITPNLRRTLHLKWFRVRVVFVYLRDKRLFCYPPIIPFSSTQFLNCGMDLCKFRHKFQITYL